MDRLGISAKDPISTVTRLHLGIWLFNTVLMTPTVTEHLIPIVGPKNFVLLNKKIY